MHVYVDSMYLRSAEIPKSYAGYQVIVEERHQTQALHLH